MIECSLVHLWEGEQQGSTLSDVEVWTRKIKETLTDKRTLSLTWQERDVETLAEQHRVACTNYCCAALQKSQVDIGESKKADQLLQWREQVTSIPPKTGVHGCSPARPSSLVPGVQTFGG